MPSVTPRALVAASFSLFLAGPALANEMCGVETFEQFGEQRAYFGAVLGACSRERGCVAAIQPLPSGGGAGFAHSLRVTLAPEGTHTVDLAATQPMPSSLPVGMAVSFANARFDFPAPTMWTAIASNEFRLTHQPTTEAIVIMLKAGREMTWSYPTAVEGRDGSVTFSLNGMTDTLNWAQCMTTTMDKASR